ncbi:hypothetical protein B0G69_5628 [Paraburkholderia sp. RAU2J]|nr:hypothetical protein B0G69_5628 [Paraburkholderia sp. RAU2J]
MQSMFLVRSSVGSNLTDRRTWKAFIASQIKLMDLAPQPIQLSLGGHTLRLELRNLPARLLLPLGNQLCLGGMALQIYT